MLFCLMVRVTIQDDHIFLERILINLHFATVYSGFINNDSISRKIRNPDNQFNNKKNIKKTPANCRSHEVELGMNPLRSWQPGSCFCISKLNHPFLRTTDESNERRMGYPRNNAEKFHQSNIWSILEWCTYVSCLEILVIWIDMIRPNPHQQRSFWQSR